MTPGQQIERPVTSEPQTLRQDRRRNPIDLSLLEGTAAQLEAILVRLEGRATQLEARAAWPESIIVRSITARRTAAG